jgi:competence protein ComEA
MSANQTELSKMPRASIFAVLVLVFSLLSGFATAEPAAVNINTATVETLAALDGVGETRAQAIIDYRSDNGPFKTASDLVNVKGIGERTLEKNADRLTVK